MQWPGDTDAAGLACCAGRALFERGRFAPRSPASHFEFAAGTWKARVGDGWRILEAIKEQPVHEALTVPVPPKMSDKVSKKACRCRFSCRERQRVAQRRQVAELAPDGLQPGQFLPAEAKRGQFAFSLEGIFPAGRGGVAACGAGGGLAAAQREAQVWLTVLVVPEPRHFHQISSLPARISEQDPLPAAAVMELLKAGLSRAL